MEAYLDVENSKMKKIKSKISEDSGNENSEESGEEGEEDGEESRELTEEEKKRGITYKMAKNKGLRKKGQKKRRNPRVKHRGTYFDVILVFQNKCMLISGRGYCSLL